MKPTERLRIKLELENLWLAILSLLRRDARNGREIRRLVKKKFGLLTGTVTAYKVLYSLEAGGFVKSKRVGKSVLYSITGRGRKELSAAKKFGLGYFKRL